MPPSGLFDFPCVFEVPLGVDRVCCGVFCPDNSTPILQQHPESQGGSRGLFGLLLSGAAGFRVKSQGLAVHPNLTLLVIQPRRVVLLVPPPGCAPQSKGLAAVVVFCMSECPPGPVILEACLCRRA